MDLHTARLQLRELSLADLPAIHQLHSLPEVDEFNTLGVPESLETTRRLLTSWLEQQQAVARTSYIFSAHRADNEAFVGLLKPISKAGKCGISCCPLIGAKG